MNLVNTSYSKEDVVILLQDVRGKIPVLDTLEREKLNQSGVHYSEMLPLEYVPTDKYMEIYNKSLNELSLETAMAVKLLSEKLYEKYNDKLVIVSLARAGTPVGILVKRYIKYRYNIDIPHYSISIIRGKGFDVKAMEYIVDNHGVEGIQFLDGWVGKGAINNVLVESCKVLEELDKKYVGLDSSLAVLTDPAGVTDLYGTTQDFLIPSACLNSTVSGLISRTVEKEGVTDNGYHGAVFYDNLVDNDKSYEFIDCVTSYFDKLGESMFDEHCFDGMEDYKGIDEVKKISEDFGIDDINKVKPGVGETTRVLLRRIPYKVLINKNADKKYLQHILRLAEEKNVEVVEYDLKRYNCCGIIKDVSDL